MPSQFNTREFRNSDGPAQHNAHAAWQDGFTGRDVTVAVIDTGIDVDSPEFAGRLSDKSTDIYASRNELQGPDDHGTNVAMVAAAARDDTGVMGIAWNATVLAIRSDEPGSCGGDNAADSTTECGFTDPAIADSIRYAVANEAKVVNISLGGPGGVTATLRNAVRDAVGAGLLVVVAAGNEGLAQLEPFGQQLGAAGNGGVILVGSVDENYEISDFSNRAGSGTGFYLAARGERVCCVYQDGSLFVDDEGFAYLFSGTSFAAPQVAGAAALLAQAFPNLTGRQIADILLRTAYDAGAAGADAVYGRGILDIARAIQPVGTTSLAGTGNVIALGDASGALSVAMGDAMVTASLPTVVTDEYERAYITDLAGTLRGAAQRNRLYGAVGTNQRNVSAGNDTTAIAFTIDASGRRAPVAGLLRLAPEEAEQARVIAARVAMTLAPETSFGFAYAQGADGLVAQLQGQDRPAFMIAGSSVSDDGALRGSDLAFALRHQFGDFGVTLNAESGRTFTAASELRAVQMRGRRGTYDVASAGMALDRRFGNLDTALGLTWMGEHDTLLGAHFHEGLGLAGANSLFVDARAGWDFARDWRLGLDYRQGWTRARSGGAVAVGSRLTSNAFAIDIARHNVFGSADTLAVRISQPLRVTGGGLNLSLPSSWDYATLLADYETQRIALSPRGQEIVSEITWRGRLLDGDAAASLFWRTDPGHYRNVRDDKGVALRWSSSF